MGTYIYRELTPSVIEAMKYFPVVTITGPRQSGKTSLSRHICPDFSYANLADISQRGKAANDPTGFLNALGRFAIIDEVQNVPDILSMIQVRVDEDPECRYILTGSSNFSLLAKVTQSLAGRTAVFTLLPFSLKEIKSIEENESIEKIIIDGLYPRKIVDNIPGEIYYSGYYNTYVERDLRDLLQVKNILSFDKFIRVLAARIGSEFNASSIAREVGVSSHTIKEWMSILTTSYIAFELRPYFNNISKQYSKMPKVYFYDTGLACYLLEIDTPETLRKHQMRGHLFENLAVCELLKKRYNEGKDTRLFFYRDKAGTEVDIVEPHGLDLSIYEVKYGDTLYPEFLRNMKKASEILKNVKRKVLIYNGRTMGDSVINIRDI
ncbi:MAG: ATP-binding protein [Muribaculaceae bacterium]|nr:ATP-binding protein [Muribaculaceae bacterium]